MLHLPLRSWRASVSTTRSIATAIFIVQAIISSAFLSTIHQAPAGAATPPPSIVDVYAGQDLQALLRNAVAGQTFVVHGGNYGNVWLGSKTYTQRVTVTGAPSETATVTGVTLFQMGNIALRGLTFSNTVVARTSSDVEISGSTIQNGIQVRDGSVRTNVLDNRIVGGTTGVWMHNVNGAPANDTITVAGNDIGGQTVDGISMGVSNNVVIDGNTIHDTVDTSYHNDGIQVSGGNNIAIRNNRLSNHDEAVMVKSERSTSPDMVVSNVRIENNIVSANRGAGVIVGGDVTSVDVVNNTMVGNGQADLHLEGANTGVRAWNNVMDKVYTMAGAAPLTYEDYNCVSVGGTGSRDVTGNPAFVDRVDFHLSSASPCRGTATPDGAPSADHNGTTRTSPWDMGAWQDSSPVEVPPPSSTHPVVDVTAGMSLEATIRQAQPGTEIVVHAGTYGPVSLQHYSWDPAVVVHAADGDVGNVHVASMTLDDVSHLVVQGLAVDGTTTVKAGADVTFTANALTTLAITNGVTDSLFSGNTVSGGSSHAVAITSAATAARNHGVRITGNTITGTGVDGIRVSLSDGTVIDGNTIAMPTENASFNAGIRITGGDDTQVTRNRITGFDQSITLQTDTLVTGNGVRNTRVENNVITGSRGAAVMTNGSDGTVIVNNTITANVFASVHVQGASNGVRIVNNVLDQLYQASNAPLPAFEDYNCVRTGGKGGHDVTSDPRFADAVDYHLAADSPCRGTADATSAPAADKAGTVRVSPVDVGAWQDSAAQTSNDIEVRSGESLEAAVRRAEPGQTVLVHEGTYPGFALVGFDWSSSPVVVRSVLGDAVSVGQVSLDNVHGLEIHGVTLAGVVTFRASSSIAFDGSSATSVAIKDGSTDVIVSGSTLSGGGTGIAISSATGAARNERISLIGNTITNQTVDGISAAAVTDLAVRANVINGTVDTSSFNTGIRMTDAASVVVARTRVTGFDQAMTFQNGTSAVRIENNLVSRSRGAGIAFLGGVNGAEVVNNTSIDNVYADIHLQAANSGVAVWNNIGERFYVASGATPPVLEDYNRFTIAPSFGVHDVRVDPQFVDRTDYRLTTASPMRGAGRTLGAPIDDFDGNLRPTSSTDLGAR